MRGNVALLGVLAVSAVACNNAVVLIEEAARLSADIDRIDVLQDINGDGDFPLEDSAFVVDPRGEIDKIVRIEFLVPVPRSAFTPAEDFIQFAPIPPKNIVVEATYFNDDPSDTSTTGDTTVVTFDISDNHYDPDLDLQVSVGVILALERLGLEGDPDEARFVFVLGRQAPAPGPPPRITSLSPSLPNLPGWSRPIERSDFLPGDDLSDVLARVDENFVGIALDERPAPHRAIVVEFDQAMTNFVASVQPEDPVGVNLVGRTFGFITPIFGARSETAAGMAPDTVYEIAAMSKWSQVNVPISAGTQDDTGLFLIPFLSDALYDELRAEGFSDDDLYGETTYRFRTGPIRITVPEHGGDLGISWNNESRRSVR